MKRNGSFEMHEARRAVQQDTEGVLGRFLSGDFMLEDIGEATWRSGGSEFFAVRWRFTGEHVGPIPGFGHTEIGPTHNMVTVSGLTLVEDRDRDARGRNVDSALDSESVVFHRFVDWLAVFAQIGVLHLGRPMPIADINFIPPERGYARRPGYNDKT
jgi:hypothetical protein